MPSEMHFFVLTKNQDFPRVSGMMGAMWFRPLSLAFL
jgi:hypothetical protein